MKITDKLTVVLLTYNAENRLEPVLEQLLALRSKPQIIAVDNGSKDGTVAMLHQYGVHVLALTKNIGAAARNKAVQQARTPYIAFCDDDVVWENAGLERVVRYFDAYPKLTVINAKILIGKSNKVDPISQEMTQSPLAGGALPGYKLLSFMGGASAVRRKDFLKAGGYEPRLFMGGEEELLATDMVVRGAELRYLPDVVVHHYPSRAHVDGLRANGVRNALWFVWRRRSLPNAWRWTWHIFKTSRQRVFLKGFSEFLFGLPWVIRTRKAVPAQIEDELQILDRQRLHSKTRSYGK